AVFGTLDKVRLEGLKVGPNITGVSADIGFAQTIEALLMMQPDVRNVVVVSGTAESDTKYLAKARTQFRNFEGRLQFTYLTDLPMAELEHRLANLPDHTVVYFLTLYRDGAGQMFVLTDSSARVAKASRVPTYVIADRFLEEGSVGGF